ncbi:hypothetical protein COOONC_27244 [Cooperia oncophora]
MRPKDRENFKRLQEQEGDSQAYNFVVEVIRKAFDVANNGQDEQEAFESIKDAYSDMKQQDKKTLLRFFKKFDGVFSRDHGGDPDSSEKEDIPGQFRFLYLMMNHLYRYDMESITLRFKISDIFETGMTCEAQIR